MTTPIKSTHSAITPNQTCPSLQFPQMFSFQSSLPISHSSLPPLHAPWRARGSWWPSWSWGRRWRPRGRCPRRRWCRGFRPCSRSARCWWWAAAGCSPWRSRACRAAGAQRPGSGSRRRCTARRSAACWWWPAGATGDGQGKQSGRLIG